MSDADRAEPVRKLKEQAKRWAHERNEAIRAWHAEGASIREIAVALDMHPRTIHRIVTDGSP